MKLVIILCIFLCACTSYENNEFKFKESDFANVKVINKVNDIPDDIKNILVKIDGRYEKMADTGTKWESGDAIMDTSLPRRGLVCFIDMGDRDLLLYEQGGFGTYFRCYLFLKNVGNKMEVYSISVSHEINTYKKLEGFLLENNYLPTSSEAIKY